MKFKINDFNPEQPIIPAVNKKGEKVDIHISDRIPQVKQTIRLMLKFFDKNDNNELENEELTNLYEAVGNDISPEEAEDNKNKYITKLLTDIENLEEGDNPHIDDIISLIETGNDASIKIINTLLNKVINEKSTYAAFMLSKIITSDKAVNHLEEIISDEDLKNIVSGLMALAKDENKIIKEYAVTALAAMGHVITSVAKETVPLFTNMFEEIPEGEIFSSIYASAGLNASITLPEAPFPARATGMMGRASVSFLEDLLKSEKSNIRAMAVLSLGRMLLMQESGRFKNHVIELIVNMLDDKEPVVRAAVIFGLEKGYLATSKSSYAQYITDKLMKMQKEDPDERVKKMAEAAAIRIALPNL